jgi:RNase P subunit RPR2
MGKTVFDIDKWWADVQKQQETTRREVLNAACPLCSADLLTRVEYAAHAESDCPPTIYVRCPDCDTELRFYLKWETILESAVCLQTLCSQDWEPNSTRCQDCHNYEECDRRYVIAFQHV